VICILCRDTPLPGYICPRCGALAAGEQTPSSRGKHGPTPNIRDAIAGLADLARRRKGKHEARKAADRQYAEQLARHTVHPQTRGSARRLMSKP
jgi:hypothetical protein